MQDASGDDGHPAGSEKSSAEWPDYSAHEQSAVTPSHPPTVGCRSSHNRMGNSFAAGSALWAAKESLASSTGWCCSGRLCAIFPSERSRNLSSCSDSQARGVRFCTTYWNSLSDKPAPDHAEVKRQSPQTSEPKRMQALLKTLCHCRGPMPQDPREISCRPSS